MIENSAVSFLENQSNAEHVRMVEAVLFASSMPVRELELRELLGDGADVAQILASLTVAYANRGVNLVRVGEAWAFRTAEDLSFLLQKEAVQARKLSKAALEVLAIIAYHQPVTRSEIEDVRGVVTSKGTLDVLMQTGWIRMRGRRKSPGRPVTYGTTPDFLDHFGLENLRDLPGVDELKGAGLLQGNVPANLVIPLPIDSEALSEDEEPLDFTDIEELGLFPPSGNEAI